MTVLLLMILSVITPVFCDLRLPDGLKQEAYCKGCKATVEALKIYNKENPKSVDYSECCQRRYMKTEDEQQPMWEKLKSCNHLLDFYEEDVPGKIRSLDWDDFQVWFCHERTFACIGVYSDSNLNKQEKDKFSDDELVRKLIEENKGRIRIPHPPNKDEL